MATQLTVCVLCYFIMISLTIINLGIVFVSDGCNELFVWEGILDLCCECWENIVDSPVIYHGGGFKELHRPLLSVSLAILHGDLAPFLLEVTLISYNDLNHLIHIAMKLKLFYPVVNSYKTWLVIDSIYNQSGMSVFII